MPELPQLVSDVGGTGKLREGGGGTSELGSCDGIGSKTYMGQIHVNTKAKGKFVVG